MCVEAPNPHSRAMADIVDRSLKAAGVTAKVRNAVQDDLDKVESITGQIGAVWTTVAGRVFFIMASDVTVHAEFKFPGNDPRFEEELIRAQSEGLMVSVTYKRQAGDVLTIESIWTYAGKATSSPRY